MQTLLTIFQNVGNMIENDCGFRTIIDDLPYPLAEYNMTSVNDSSFIDIGSGFGKPVFHAAM